MFEALVVISVVFFVSIGVSEFYQRHHEKSISKELSGGDVGVYRLLTKKGCIVISESHRYLIGGESGGLMYRELEISQGGCLVLTGWKDNSLKLYPLRDYFLHPLDPSEEEVMLFDIETGEDYIAMMNSFTPDWRYSYED